MNKFITKSSTEMGDPEMDDDDVDLEALMRRPDVSKYISSVNAFINDGISRPIIGTFTQSEIGKTSQVSMGISSAISSNYTIQQSHLPDTDSSIYLDDNDDDCHDSGDDDGRDDDDDDNSGGDGHYNLNDDDDGSHNDDDSDDDGNDYDDIDDDGNDYDEIDDDGHDDDDDDDDYKVSESDEELIQGTRSLSSTAVVLGCDEDEVEDDCRGNFSSSHSIWASRNKRKRLGKETTHEIASADDAMRYEQMSKKRRSSGIDNSAASQRDRSNIVSDTDSCSESDKSPNSRDKSSHVVTRQMRKRICTGNAEYCMYIYEPL